MKLYTFILLAFIIAYVNSVDCDEITGVSKKSDCHEKLSDKDKTANLAYCCYIENEEGDKHCYGVTQVYYDSMESLVKAAKKAGTENKGIIDCNSNYIKFGFLSLLLSFL